jgi:hypothetical protein
MSDPIQVVSDQWSAGSGQWAAAADHRPLTPDHWHDLVPRCRALYTGSGEALDWLAEVRRYSPRLDRESDSLTDKLRRVRNLATRLGRAAGRSVSVGFFGLSQAGKSYLISAMAAGEGGELETELEGRRLNFIQHVNPPGHGKEATGLVTRFTRRPSIQGGAAPPGYPLELSLFSEVDLAKVLGNAFFNDFDREQVEWDLSPAHLRRHLAGLESRRTRAPTGGVNEDNVVELLEYFEQRFPKTTAQLRADYWPSAIALAPYLGPADRAALFSVLWGEVRELTETYLTLRQGLASVGFADTAFAPVSALVRTDAAGELSQSDSIMNVDILERLGRDAADTLQIVPRRDGELLPPVALPRSLLAALTTELRFVLADPPRTGLLEQVDLLDFPGYRGRLAVADIGEVRKQLQDDQVDPVAQLVLRGKVAYLFERYTDDQEMNVLVLCAPSHKQSDVKDLGPVLETWVHSTQGADPQTRARRAAGLIWAITMFDFRLNPVPGETEDLMRKGWEGMMKLALLERFGAYHWLHEWAPGRPFDNLFLVRKPRMAAAVIETDAAGERAIIPSQQGRLELLRRTFCEEPTVRKHLQDPETAWDAMLRFNDGGIARVAEYLSGVALPETKLTRIREQLEAVVADLTRHRFGPYYRAEGAAEVEGKRQLAERVIGALRQRPNRFADLLRVLQPPREGLRALYLRADEGSELAGEAVAVSAAPTVGPVRTTAVPPDGGLIDLGSLFAAAPTVMEKAAQDQDVGWGEERTPTIANRGAARFVRAVQRYWIGHLKALPEDLNWPQYLGIDKNVLEDLIGELITAADRLGLERSLLDLLESAESQAAATRARLAERQVYVTAARIARFVDYLGCDDLPVDERPRSLADARRPVFAPPAPIAPGAMPALGPVPVNFPALFIVDWFEAFRVLTIANAGHAAGRDISPEQNARLGEVLAHIAGY